MSKANDLIAVHHFSFTVTDLARTVDFYTNVVGLELRSLTHYEWGGIRTAALGEKWEGELGADAATEIAVLELNGVTIAFNQYLKPPSRPYHGDQSIAGSAHLALKVKNIDKVRERLEAAGVAFRTPVLNFPETGRRPWLWCQFDDPDGLIVELAEDMPVSYQLESMAERIRETRQARGLTLKKVAAESGLSSAHLSQVERGDAVPSISALLAISGALGVPSDYFLRPEPNGRELDLLARDGTIVPPIAESDASTVGAYVAAIVTSSERNALRVEGGIEWVRITGADADVQLLEVRYDVGAVSDELGLGRRGTESGVVLEGTLLVEIGTTKKVLTPGSSIAYDRSVSRRFSNVGTVPVVGIWAFLRDPS